MFSNWLRVLLTGVLIILANGDKVRYDNSQVFRVNVTSEQQLDVLQSLQGTFDFWKEPIVGRTADVLVHPEQLDQFQRLLSLFGVENELKIENVQRYVLRIIVSMRDPNDIFTIAV